MERVSIVTHQILPMTNQVSDCAMELFILPTFSHKSFLLERKEDETKTGRRRSFIAR